MKKLIKRILLILLAVLIAVQAPFVYRRYKLGQLAGKVAELNSVERPPAADRKYKEYKGIIHAHTNLGGHSTGSFDELIAAANANDLDFVIMTEHWSDTIDTAALTLNGVYGKTLFIGGNEIDTADGDRFLMIPGSNDAASLRKLSTNVVLEKLHAENRLALVTYPEKFNSWDSNFDGIEAFSLHTNAKKMNPFTAIFDGIWSYPAYPELMLASYFKRPDENLRKFDEIAAERQVSLFAGTDAHSNIGFHLFGDDAGNKGLNIKLDDYATIFRLARQHVWIDSSKQLTRESLIEAIKAGRSFIGFDVLADTSGFKFESLSALDMGLEWSPDHHGVRVTSPLRGRIVILLNGEKFDEVASARSREIGLSTPGTYRVEVYLDQLGPPFDKMPWIISNPIYVR
ncbi:MAG: hypothetical protein HOP17_17325 [Acidobacteria bacterium]|nr:hypothetical protein [Acidobacteriota bacterium]